MMDDHEIICQVRNDLADALKALLKAEIMDATDFYKSREHAQQAVIALNTLLLQSFVNDK